MELQIQAFKLHNEVKDCTTIRKVVQDSKILTYISTFCDDSTIVKLSRIARYAHANIFRLYKEYKFNQVRLNSKLRISSLFVTANSHFALSLLKIYNHEITRDIFNHFYLTSELGIEPEYLDKVKTLLSFAKHVTISENRSQLQAVHIYVELLLLGISNIMYYTEDRRSAMNLYVYSHFEKDDIKVINIKVVDQDDQLNIIRSHVPIAHVPTISLVTNLIPKNDILLSTETQKLTIPNCTFLEHIQFNALAELDLYTLEIYVNESKSSDRRSHSIVSEIKTLRKLTVSSLDVKPTTTQIQVDAVFPESLTDLSCSIYNLYDISYIRIFEDLIQKQVNLERVSLTLGDTICNINFTQMKKLKFLNLQSSSLTYNILPDSVEELSFGRYKDQPIPNTKNLKKLSLTSHELVSFTSLSEIISGLDTLEELVCSFYVNSIFEINSYPKSLKKLVVSTYNRIGLYTLPEGLEDLRCISNVFECKTSLPSSLKHLYVSAYEVKEFPELPVSLNSFDLDLLNLKVATYGGAPPAKSRLDEIKDGIKNLFKKKKEPVWKIQQREETAKINVKIEEYKNKKRKLGYNLEVRNLESIKEKRKVGATIQ